MISEIKKIVSFLFQFEKKIFLKTIFFQFFSNIIDLVTISLLMPYILLFSKPEEILDNNFIKQIILFFSLEYEAIVIWSSIIIIVLLVLSSLFGILANIKVLKYSHNFQINYSDSLIKSYFSLNILDFFKLRKTLLSKNIIVEVQRFSNNVIVPVIKIISTFFMLVSLILVMILIDFKVTLVILLIIALIYSFLILNFRSKILKNGSEISNLNAKQFAVVNESLDSIKEVKLNNLELFYSNNLFNINVKKNRLTLQNEILGLSPKYLVEFILFFSIILSIGYLSIIDRISDYIATITVFIFIGYRLLPLAQSIYNYLTVIRANIDSYNKISFSISRNKNEFLNVDLIQKIEFLNVDFSYSKKNVFKNFSCKVEEYGLIKVSGNSGSGKTTFLNLMLKLYQPSNGSVLFNGVNLSFHNLTNHFSYVSQDVKLFDSSIRDNITLNSLNIDEGLLSKAILFSELNSFVEEMEFGLETIIGEDSNFISGGQRNRIGLARAIYSSKHLILDETLGNIDFETKYRILSNLKMYSENKFVFIVTHETMIDDFFDQMIEL